MTITSKTNIARKINAIMKASQGVKKEKMNNGRGRSVHKIIEEFHPLLEKFNVSIIPVSVRDVKHIFVEKNGRTQTSVTFIQTYLIIDGDSGEEIMSEVCCEGIDAMGGDKASRIASSYAIKTLLEQMFMIVEEDVEDYDDQQKRLSKPKIPSLANIQKEAEKLLPPQQQPQTQQQPQQQPQQQQNKILLGNHPDEKKLIADTINKYFKDADKDKKIEIFKKVVNGSVTESFLDSFVKSINI